MEKIIVAILTIVLLISCNKEETLIDENGPVCEIKTDIMSPTGYEITNIGEIDFNGSARSFQFVNELAGFAMLGNNVGGFVEIFKTTNGGETWTDLNIGIDQLPVGMVFKDENTGIITVHDVTGCPPPNCLNKCVILRTEDGGENWFEHEIEELQGILYHPQYGNDGNLYALLTLDQTVALMKSSDDGLSWEELFSSEELGFSLTTFTYKHFENTFYISGKEGKIFVVNNNGELLNTIEIENTDIWDLEIIDENNLIVVHSGKVIKSVNGGDTWETIYEESARMIGFDSVDKGLIFLEKSSCPTDVHQVNDLIASTNTGGFNWIEAEETTTNLRLNFQNSQQMPNGKWNMMIGNKLMEIQEE